MSRSESILAIASLSAALAAGPASAGPTVPAASLALETFDAAWTIIHDTHFDPQFNGVDWDAVRDELRPRAAEVASPEEVRPIIDDLLSRLGQSHFALLRQDAAARLESPAVGGGDVGIELRWADGEAIVFRADPDGPAAKAGVRPGWIVSSIDGEAVVDLAAEVVASLHGPAGRALLRVGALENRLHGRPGDPVAVTFRDGEGANQRLELRRRPTPGHPIRFGNLPPFPSRLDTDVRGLPGGGQVGVIRMSHWMVPLMRPLDRAIDRFRSMDGIVIDLRGNPGGVGAMVMGVAGHFMDEREELGRIRTRVDELRFLANPRIVNADGERVRPFDGPLAILVDGLSASTSEVFAAGMQDRGRARVFGERTAGAALPASMDRLPNGDVLYHAIADYRSPDGEVIEGVGVTPDEIVPLGRSDLLAGRDAVLDAALRWIERDVAERSRPAPTPGSEPSPGGGAGAAGAPP